MIIKRLDQTLKAAQQIGLKEGQGLFYVDAMGPSSFCLLISVEKIDEVAKALLGPSQDLKYFGNAPVLEAVLKFQPSLALRLKSRITDGSFSEFWYYPHEGKLRALKNEKAILRKAKAEKIAPATPTPTPLATAPVLSPVAPPERSELPRKKKVLIVDDSRTIQTLLARIIGGSDKFEVVGQALRPSEARAFIEKSPPDMITLDIHMPEMTGVDFLKSYLKFKNIPVMVISSVSISEGPLVMEALSNGASTFMQKPELKDISEVGPQILEKLEGLTASNEFKKVEAKKLNLKFTNLEGLIAIGSSTGGTHALEVIFRSLPDEIPPIVVVQHIPSVFSKALAERLDKCCPFTVKEAEDGEVIKSNTIYIAAGAKQMKVLKKARGLCIETNDDPPVNRFRPSVDYLFMSIKDLRVNPITGVILTGMGSDGAKGLLELRKAGARTIGQDEASSVVYGMPREAFEIGAVETVASLGAMAEQIILTHNKAQLKKAS